MTTLTIWLAMTAHAGPTNTSWGLGDDGPSDLASAVAEAPIVFEAQVLWVDEAMYLSRTDGFLQSWPRLHVRILRPLKGKVDTEHIDLWLVFDQLAQPGQRLVFAGGPSRAGRHTYSESVLGWTHRTPYYHDLLVPQWTLSVRFDHNPLLAEHLPDRPGSCFRDGRLQEVTTRRPDGRHCSEEEWTAFVDHVASWIEPEAEPMTLAGVGSDHPTAAP